MTPALILIDRGLRRLRDILATGNVSELQHAINEIDSAGEIIISSMEKRGCLSCMPTGRVNK
jgi:hypothetical protein